MRTTNHKCLRQKKSLTILSPSGYISSTYSIQCCAMQCWLFVSFFSRPMVRRWSCRVYCVYITVRRVTLTARPPNFEILRVLLRHTYMVDSYNAGWVRPTSLAATAASEAHTRTAQPVPFHIPILYTVPLPPSRTPLCTLPVLFGYKTCVCVCVYTRSWGEIQVLCFPFLMCAAADICRRMIYKCVCAKGGRTESWVRFCDAKGIS